MNPLQPYLQILASHFPTLKISSAEINQYGQYNDVLIVNNALVFRFAKVQPAVETLQYESALLEHLQGKLPLPIPNPIYQNFDPPSIGSVYMGYQSLPGTPFWRADFGQIKSLETKKSLASQLGMFLHQLHQIQLPTALLNSLPQADHLDSWTNLYERIQTNLFQHMRPDARQQVSRHFEQYLSQPDQHQFEPCLRHGDFGPGNILYDATSLSISGIIDFGGAAVGDPAADFAGLYISYGEMFYNLCSKVYPAMASALDRVKFICGTFALQEAIFGFENGDESAFQAGMRAYI